MKATQSLVMLTVLVFAGAAQPVSIFSFPDVLNVRNTPVAARDLSAFCFSDRGAWHGFSLPSERDTSRYGAFPGPRLMHNGRWLSDGIARFRLTDASSGEAIPFPSDERALFRSYPGMLRQRFDLPFLSLEFDLWFATERTALIRATIRNAGTDARELRLAVDGTLLLEGFAFTEITDGVLSQAESSSVTALIQFPPSALVQTSLSADAHSYSCSLREIVIPPNGTRVIVLAQSVYLDSHERGRDAARLRNALVNPDSSFEALQRHWQHMLVETLSRGLASTGPPYDRAAVKCLQTLVTNWRRPSGGLRYDGLFPSYAYEGFNGFWAWDSWKHAAALASVHPIVARAQVRAMFAAQNAEGMVADCIFRDSAESNWLNTKPPLAAWAVAEILEESKDTAFVRRMLPALIRYHAWWYTHRDHDGNGLCEYGATTDSLIAAKWESGMDNAVRFDDATLLKNTADEAWSLDQESVDLNSFLYAEKRHLATLLRSIGNARAAARFDREADTLREQVQNAFYCTADSFFYDRRLKDHTFIRVKGPEGWIPLWTGVATAEQAEGVATALRQRELFNTFLPFPTVQANHPLFNWKGYWRGPVWIDQAYFAIRGLDRYGFRAQAAEMREKLLLRLNGFLDSDHPIYETYDPLTGNPQNAAHFSWSASMLLMILTAR